MVDEESNWNPEVLRQFFTALHSDLKESIDDRLTELEKRYQQKVDDVEKRYTERFVFIEKSALARVDSSERNIQTALVASDKAILKAEEQQKIHNHAQNEWRATVTDLSSTVAERARHETETAIRALSQRIEVSIVAANNRIDDSRSRLDKIEGRFSGSATTYAAIGAALATLIALSGVVISWNNSNAVKDHIAVAQDRLGK